MTTSFIGSGIGFPLRFDPAGRVALVADESEIEEAIELILRTAPGERPMRPEFGCGLHALVFEPNNATVMGLAAFEVRSALARWERRIEVKEVTVVPPEPGGEARMMIDIVYVVRSTNDRRNLVFPYYTIAPEQP